MTIFSVQIPNNLIEEMAEKKGTLVSLKNMNSIIEVKVPFKSKHKHFYNCFDERARIETIIAILS